MSLRLRWLTAVGHLALKPKINRASEPLPLRVLFERFAAVAFRPPPHTLVRDIQLAPGLHGLVVSNRPGSHPPAPGKVVLYFHGGAFMAGSPKAYTALAARIARLARVEVVLPGYRLAPEHPFPAAIQDARAAWDALLAQGYAPENIVIGGDSAGGNLAAGLLSALLGEHSRPAGLFAFSPVTDLTFSGGSIAANARRDSMLPIERRDDFHGFYLAGAAPDDPRASPLLAEFPAPPPVFLQYSASEILCDDSRRLAAKLRAAGGEVICDEWPDAPHVWVMFDRYIPEARTGLKRAAAFIARALAA